MSTYDHHPYPENSFWVIEYADSSLAKDLEFKNQIYAEAGMREYWVVNLKQMELIVFGEIIASGYQTQKTLTDGRISPTAFPAVAFSVNRFIRR